jgi:hypothetical protein
MDGAPNCDDRVLSRGQILSILSLPYHAADREFPSSPTHNESVVGPEG